MKVIELRDIRKIYQLGEVEVSALRGVSLSIDRGEFVALVGPSGSGKSTLMNTLGCLDHPTSGSYLLAGQEIVTLSSDERALVRNQRIGFIFQSFNLLARTSALENVELPMLYARGGVSAWKRRQRATELLTQVGLGERLDHHPGQLSGGQQQRVAIARALVNNPAILMCDEPTGNLDTKTSKEVIQLFRDLNASGITVILVTHDQDVARCAKRVVVLRDGLVVEDTSDFNQAMKVLHSSEPIEEPAETPV